VKVNNKFNDNVSRPLDTVHGTTIQDIYHILYGIVGSSRGSHYYPIFSERVPNIIKLCKT